MRKSGAIFLDKDGTLIHDHPYNVDPAKIEFLPGVAKSLSLLTSLGFKLIVVSNQSGVAHGKFPESAVQAVRDRLEDLFIAADAFLDGFYYCPHHPQGSMQAYARQCVCRKPLPGLLLQAASDHGIDLSSSWMIGDILDDVEAGARARCRTIFLDTGHETEWRWSPKRIPEHRVISFYEAARVIMHSEIRLKARL
jgi:D-glycero-D-manno-heptose 1,7-bisphosphate phosphatase